MKKMLSMRKIKRMGEMRRWVSIAGGRSGEKREK